MGYDLDEATARALSRRQEAMLDTAEPADPDLLREEQDLLELFADITELSGASPMTPRMSIPAATRSTSSPIWPSSTRAAACPALRHPAAALWRATASCRRPDARTRAGAAAHVPVVARLRTVAPAIMSILDRWRQHREQLAAAMTDERLSVLDRLIASARRGSRKCATWPRRSASTTSTRR